MYEDNDPEDPDNDPLPYHANYCPNCAEREPQLHWAEGNLYCTKCDPEDEADQAGE